MLLRSGEMNELANLIVLGCNHPDMTIAKACNEYMADSMRLVERIQGFTSSEVRCSTSVIECYKEMIEAQMSVSKVIREQPKYSHLEEAPILLAMLWLCNEALEEETESVK